VGFVIPIPRCPVDTVIRVEACRVLVEIVLPIMEEKFRRVVVMVDPVRVEFQNPVLVVKVDPRSVEYVVLMVFSVEPVMVDWRIKRLVVRVLPTTVE
jgi:hypothetical protein